MSAAQPRTPNEAQRGAERINKELIEDATMQILCERGAIRKSVMDALIDDKLKLQAAKRLGIEITNEEVVKDIILERLAEGEEPDVNAYYAPSVAYGIGRKTIQEIIRAELAWRAVMNRTYGPPKVLERNSAWGQAGVKARWSRLVLMVTIAALVRGHKLSRRNTGRIRERSYIVVDSHHLLLVAKRVRRETGTGQPHIPSLLYAGLSLPINYRCRPCCGQQLKHACA
jgi:hypothetical protein